MDVKKQTNKRLCTAKMDNSLTYLVALLRTYVHVITKSRPCTDFLRIARARIERVPMCGNIQHTWVVVERFLGT